MKLAKYRNRILAVAAAIALGATGIGSTYATWSKTVEAEDAVTVTTGDATLELLETKWYWLSEADRNFFFEPSLTPRGTYHEITDLASFRPVPGMYIVRVHKLQANLQGNNLWGTVRIQSATAPAAPLQYVSSNSGVKDSRATNAPQISIASPVLSQGNATGKDILSWARYSPKAPATIGFAELFYFPWESGNESINLQSAIGPATITLSQCRKDSSDCTAS